MSMRPSAVAPHALPVKPVDQPAHRQHAGIVHADGLVAEHAGAAEPVRLAAEFVERGGRRHGRPRQGSRPDRPVLPSPWRWRRGCRARSWRRVRRGRGRAWRRGPPATSAGTSDQSTAVRPLVALAALMKAVATSVPKEDEETRWNALEHPRNAWPRSSPKPAASSATAAKPLATVMPRSPSPSLPSWRVQFVARRDRRLGDGSGGGLEIGCGETHRSVLAQLTVQKAQWAGAFEQALELAVEPADGDRGARHLHRGGVAADQRHDDGRRRGRRAAPPPCGT